MTATFFYKDGTVVPGIWVELRRDGTWLFGGDHVDWDAISKVQLDLLGRIINLRKGDI